MAAGDLITQDFQVEYDGVLFGANDYEFIDLDLFNSPEMRVNDRNRPQSDGQFEGDDYYAGRVINFQIEVWGDTAAELSTRIQTFLGATSKKLTEIPLVVQLPGWTDKLRINCRPRRRSGPKIDDGFNIGFKSVSTVQMHSTDPRIYGNTEQSQSGTATVAGGGLVFAAVAPFVFAAPGESGIISCPNDGGYETWPVFTITATGGSLTNPSIEGITAGKTLEFTGVMTTGQTLVIDAQARTILLGGTASRYTWLTDPTQWFSLTAGANSVRFAGSSSGAPTLSVAWRHAWA